MYLLGTAMEDELLIIFCKGVAQKVGISSLDSAPHLHPIRGSNSGCG
jgi:hypothetical protein